MGLIAFAIYDSVKTAQIKDQQVQESTLKGQLAEFLLSTREPDGSSLLENPAEFSKAERPLRVVSLKRPFFGYFLNRANARVFKTEDIRWDAPRSCLVEFSQAVPPAKPSSPFSMQACFGAVPGDTSGRYVYFSLRYPSSTIRRHTPGKPTTESDRVVVKFAGDRETKLTLVFEAPPLAKTRYPSQMKRFDGLHEVTGFLSDEVGRSTRYVNAQAFERRAESTSEAGQNFVTLVGRINAAALPGGNEDFGAWPTAAIKSLGIGVEIHPATESTRQVPMQFGFAVGTTGRALVSLELAYLSAIPSRANLEVSAATIAQGWKVVWRSADAGLAPLPRRTGWWQRFSDWWADRLVAALGYKAQPVQVRQQQKVSGHPGFVATLAADPIVLPDIATRAFVWLTAALLGVLGLCIVWFRALARLQRITQTAYAMTVAHRAEGSLAEYSASRDEIGTLGRVLHLLISRSRARSASLVKRMRREESQRVEEIRLAQEHVKTRQSILDAIGHEIRSPLQSLLNRTTNSPDLRADLERIRRAVETLYFATSVEAGLKSGDIVVSSLDLASYVCKLASNLSEQGKGVSYAGPRLGVFATFDPIALDQILDNVVDNALRYRTLGSIVELRLERLADGVAIEVFNCGKPIAETDLETIFNYGVSDNSTPENRGLGLFASRIHVLAMRGTIRVENRCNGVAVIVTLPSTTGTDG